MDCPNCGREIDRDFDDPEVLADAKADGIHVCECCEEIDVSKLIRSL